MTLRQSITEPRLVAWIVPMLFSSESLFQVRYGLQIDIQDVSKIHETLKFQCSFHWLFFSQGSVMYVYFSVHVSC
jgi:hypothetical protein